VEVAEREIGTRELGFDLGLKEFAAFSDKSIENIEAQDKGDPCPDCQSQEGLPAQGLHANRARVRIHLHWEREQQAAGANTHGEVCAGLWLEHVPKYGRL